MNDVSLEFVAGLVVLFSFGITTVVEMFLKPLLLEYGLKVPDNLRQVIIYVMLMLVSAALTFGVDFDIVAEYAPSMNPVLSTLLTAAGLSGTARAAHEMLKRLGSGGFMELEEYTVLDAPAGFAKIEDAPVDAQG